MAKVPKLKPQLSKTEALALVDPFGVPEKVILLGIRGYYKKTMGNPLQNDRGIYDDAIFIIAPDVFFPYNANTDPSVDYKKGVSVLNPGLHYYKKGKHGLSKNKNPYDALRPATKGEKLSVTRDGQGQSEGIAINIHRGGYNTTSSEGCQTIYPTQWISFQRNVYELMDRYNQRTIPYILIEQS